MTFHLVRIGWPNAVAVLALAVMPIVSLTILPSRHAENARTQVVEAETQSAMVSWVDYSVE